MNTKYLDKVIQGDSVEIVKDIETESIHAIISDIPYGINCDEWDVLHENTNSALGGTSASQVLGGSLFKRRGKPLNGWSEADKKIPLEYQQWCSNWATEWLRVLKPGASCLIFAGRRYAHRCIAALEDAGFTFKDMLAWEKEMAAQRAQHLSAIYERRQDFFNAKKWEGWRVANPRPIFEPILWFQKPYKTGGTIATNVLENGVGAWNERAFLEFNTQTSKEMICSNVIKVKTTKQDTGLHVAQKPLSLLAFLIELVTMEGQTVFDPFMGSGTTCVASQAMNRHFIGIDIDKKHVDTAKERLNIETKSPFDMERIEQLSMM